MFCRQKLKLFAETDQIIASPNEKGINIMKKIQRKSAIEKNEFIEEERIWLFQERKKPVLHRKSEIEKNNMICESENKNSHY